MRIRGTLTALAAILWLGAMSAQAQLSEPKPSRLNFFSRNQDIQLGREAAAQLERQLPVVNDPAINGYLRRIGERLAKQPHAGNWPFQYHFIASKDVNAFALPGGPIFVNTGLMSAVENEAQLAGVLAHEMSHVVLRHGTSQASKANLIELPAMLAGAILGNGSLLGQLGQLGVGIFAGSVLLRYSREAERDADLNGAIIMNEAGYNPMEMARFFEKLEAQGGKENVFEQFLSDHPSPGNRVSEVEKQISYLPQRTYIGGDRRLLDAEKRKIAAIRIPSQPQGAIGQAPPPPSIRPSSTFRSYEGREFSISYPDNWQAIGGQQSASLAIAPRGAFVQRANGRTELGYGVTCSYYFPEDERPDLDHHTNDLIRQLAQTNPGLKIGREGQRRIRVSGQEALLTTLNAPSPYHNESEVDVLATTVRPEGLFYIIFTAPASEYKQVEPIFEKMLNSVRFPD